MQSIIIPLVKSEKGSLGDIDNYRAIAISNAASKILESIFLEQLNTSPDSDSSQFGFKSGHSTELCTHMLKQVVKYYTDRGSHVFTCFVDFTKAFDYVTYWKLFCKLLEDGDIVALLNFWYSRQLTSVRWKSAVSSSFHCTNGTRQGSVLSPFLFKRYIRDLLATINGCNIG